MKQTALKFGGLLLAFALPFEMIANLAVEVREQGPLFPLSYFENPTRVMSDPQGYRSSLYRGQKRRWAFFGTSYLFSPQIHQEDLWSLRIQHKHQDLHIANFSYAGSTQTVAETIRQSVERNETFDKVFLVLSIGFGERAVPAPLTETFTSTGRFFPKSDDSGAIVSWKILKRLLTPEIEAIKISVEESLRFDKQAPTTENTNTPDEFEFLDQNRLGDFKTCYQTEMLQRKCELRYHGKLSPGMSQEQRWRLYESDYLPCQKEADLACGVKRRHDEIPKGYYGNQVLYRNQIAKLVEMARPLSKNIYLVIRAVGAGETLEPDTLAYSTGLVAGELDTKYVVLSTKSSAKLERLRNQELLEAASMFQTTNPSVTVLNLQGLFDQTNVSSSYFRDYAHLSKEGNLLVANYLLELFKENK